MTASVQFVLRLDSSFSPLRFFQINGFDKNSEIASTPLTDGADNYYREGAFGHLLLLISFRHDEPPFVARSSKCKSPSDKLRPAAPSVELSGKSQQRNAPGALLPCSMCPTGERFHVANGGSLTLRLGPFQMSLKALRLPTFLRDYEGKVKNLHAPIE